MSLSSLGVAANFAHEYYTRMVRGENVGAFVTASCQVTRDDKSYKTPQAVAAFYKEQAGKTSGNFRVTISGIEMTARESTGVKPHFTVQGQFNYADGRALPFTHVFQLEKQPSQQHPLAFSIAGDHLRLTKSSPLSSLYVAAAPKPQPQAPAAAETRPAPTTKVTTTTTKSPATKPAVTDAADDDDAPVAPARPSMLDAWSAATPPAFAAKPATAVPPLESGEPTPHSTPFKDADKPVPKPKQTKPAASPQKPAADKPAEKPQAPVEQPKKSAPAPTKPAPEPAPEKEKPAAPETKPAVVEAVSKAEVKPAEPDRPLTFAERLRLGQGGKPTPAAPAAPAAKEESAPSKTEAVAERAEPPAPAPVRSPQAAPAEPSTAVAAADSKDEPEKSAEQAPTSKPANAWARGSLNFAAAAKAEAPSVAPAPAAAPATNKTPAATAAAATAPASAPAAAAPAKDADKRRTTGTRPPVDQGGLAGAVSHYHVFVRGLSQDTTEEQVFEALAAKGVPVRKGIKIDSKRVPEEVRDRNADPEEPPKVVDRVRTFAFVCLETNDREEIREYVERLKKDRPMIGRQALTCDEVHDKPIFSKEAAAAAATKPVATPATKKPSPKAAGSSAPTTAVAPAKTATKTKAK